MGITNFESLDHVKQALKQYEAMTDENKEKFLSLGALTVLVSAMLKIVEEVEALKASQATR
jgi:hypothetical protein